MSKFDAENRFLLCIEEQNFSSVQNVEKSFSHQIPKWELQRFRCHKHVQNAIA